MKMNKFGFALAALVMAMGSGSALAAEGNDTGLVIINGAISAGTCDITTKDGKSAGNVTVQMPTVEATEVKALDAEAAGAGKTTFELLLSNCDVEGVATIAFSSPEFVDVASGTLKNNDKITGYAEGVSVALHNNIDGNKKAVMVGRPDDTNAQTLNIAKYSGTGTEIAGLFAFTTSYVLAQGATAATGGLVSTNTTFDITYQ
nr:hypothetical protein [uncultured Enterobacter sp.]